MPDFSELLSQTADSAERPVPLPAGTYSLMVEGYELVESTRKGTPGVQVNFKVVAPGDDVDMDDFPMEKLQKKTIRETFWLTDDARYRLTEFLGKLGLDVTNRPYSELLEEMTNGAVDATIVQTPSQNKSGEMTIYNNIAGFIAAV